MQIVRAALYETPYESVRVLRAGPSDPRGLRRKSAAASLLRSWVRIPQGSWTFACCECCVLSGRGLCDELIIIQRSPTECDASLCVI